MWLAWERRMVSLKGLNFALNGVQTVSFYWELWHCGLSPRSSLSSRSSRAQAARIWKEGATDHSIGTAMSSAFCSFIRQLEQFCIFILFFCDPMVLIRVVYGNTHSSPVPTPLKKMSVHPLSTIVCTEVLREGGFLNPCPLHNRSSLVQRITAGAAARVPQLCHAIPQHSFQWPWKIILIYNYRIDANS